MTTARPIPYMFGGGPTNARDRDRFGAMTSGERARTEERARELYDGSRTVAACWKQAITERETSR